MIPEWHGQYLLPGSMFKLKLVKLLTLEAPLNMLWVLQDLKDFKECFQLTSINNYFVRFNNFFGESPNVLMFRMAS